MPQPSKSTPVTELASIMERYPDRVYWSGKLTDSIFEELCRLPIELPSGGSYVLYSKGKTLYLGCIDEGISRFRVTPDRPGRATVDVTEQGVVLTEFGSHKFDTLILLNKECSLPPGAISIRSINAPIDLLDQYADLRSASKGRALTQSETNEANNLIEKIREQFAKAQSRERYSPSRSTPEPSGESRGGFSTSRGG